jgi:hypothetical protein
MDSIPTPTDPSGTQENLELQFKRRPWSVTLLMLGVLILTVINLIRFGLSIKYWVFLSSRLGISPIYLALTGFLWSVAGVILLWGLWKAKTWAPKLMQAVALTYALYYWLDHIFRLGHSVSGTSGAIRVLLPINWRFSTAVTVVGLVYMVWTLSGSKTKSYFGLVEPGIDQNQVNNDNQ